MCSSDLRNSVLVEDVFQVSKLGHEIGSIVPEMFHSKEVVELKLLFIWIIHDLQR